MGRNRNNSGAMSKNGPCRSDPTLKDVWEPCSSHFSASGWSFFYPWVFEQQNPIDRQKFNLVSFSHMRFIEIRDCKLPVSDGSVNVLSTCKKKLLIYVRFCCWVYPLQLDNFKFTIGRGAARIFLGGGLKLWKQNALKRKKLLVSTIAKEST